MKKKVKKVIRKLPKTHIFLHGLLLFCLFFLGLSSFLQNYQSFAANIADYILRPLFGNGITLKLESAGFTLEDSLNQIKYHFVKPDDKVFVDTQQHSLLVSNRDNTFALPPIHVSSFTARPGEGIWVPIQVNNRDILMAQTFLRPDPQRDYAIVALVAMNMQKLGINAVAGTWEPGEAENRGPGFIPKPVQQTNNLLAAFNGGFQKKDGAYGMVVDNHTYLPLQKNLATLVLFKNTKPQLIRYTGQDFGKDVAAIRQNGPMLIENGKIVTASSAWNMQTWGLTTTNTMYTWRSGLGITRDGNLIYAAGPSLIPETLALALQEAGAINAMQLDINPVWVRFVLYTPIGAGQYTYQPLLKDMVNGGYPYLVGYQKDFFYVYKAS